MFENDIYEVESFKSSINLDNPIQIGFFILQYAKLRMLQFYYDCLTKYLKPKSFELIETDTDSLYMALNQEELEMCVKPELLTEFESDIYSRCNNDLKAVWFPRKCCEDHIALDRRFCGVFKLEFAGIKMVALCSKSYIIETESGKQKISCKGISKRLLSSPMEKFLHTLNTSEANVSRNMGFRLHNSEMCTYDQTKIGFNYFYCKREVLEDGIHTKPLSLVLSPWKYDILLVNEMHKPLSNLYHCELVSDSNQKFFSAEQFYLYLFAEFCGNDSLKEKLIQCSEAIELRSMLSEITEPKEWLDVKVEKMAYVLRHKFNQCVEFRNDL